jgi:hypothetical protein
LHYGKNQDRKINCVAVQQKLPAEWLRLGSAKEFIEQNQAEIKLGNPGFSKQRQDGPGERMPIGRSHWPMLNFFFGKRLPPGSDDPVLCQLS